MFFEKILPEIEETCKIIDRWIEEEVEKYIDYPGFNGAFMLRKTVNEKIEAMNKKEFRSENIPEPVKYEIDMNTAVDIQFKNFDIKSLKNRILFRMGEPVPEGTQKEQPYPDLGKREKAFDYMAEAEKLWLKKYGFKIRAIDPEYRSLSFFSVKDDAEVLKIEESLIWYWVRVPTFYKRSPRLVSEVSYIINYGLNL